MVISTGVLSIVMGGTVEVSVTLNEWSPSRTLSSMIDTIAHAIVSLTPNTISSGSAAEKSSPITTNIWKQKVEGGYVYTEITTLGGIVAAMLFSHTCIRVITWTG